MISINAREAGFEYLFPYCLSRILAKRWQYATKLAALPSCFIQNTCAPGVRVISPRQVWSGQWPFDAITGRRLERAEVHVAPGHHVLLSGSFQRFELFSDHIDEIRKGWLKLRHPVISRPPGDLLICLNWRQNFLGPHLEATAHIEKWALQGLHSVDEINTIVRCARPKRIYLLLADSSDLILTQLKHLRPNVLVWKGVSTFASMLTFQQIAIGQNAPSWWAAMLGIARCVYFPKTDRGLWSKPEVPASVVDEWRRGIDLRVEEERFIYDW